MLWREERDNPELAPSGKDLRSVGVSPGGIESDLETGAEMADAELGTGDIDTGAGPNPVTAPPAAPGGVTGAGL